MLIFLRQYWKSIVVILIIFYLSLAPASEFKGIPAFPHEDKLIHFLMYFGLAAALFWEYASKHGFEVVNKKKTFLLIFGLPAMWGGSMEICQLLFTTTRSAEWLDELADAVGACAGYFIGRWLLTLYYTRKQQ